MGSYHTICSKCKKGYWESNWEEANNPQVLCPECYKDEYEEYWSSFDHGPSVGESN